MCMLSGLEILLISAAALIFLLEVLVPMIAVGIPILRDKLMKWRKYE